MRIRMYIHTYIRTYVHTYVHTDIQTDRHTDTQTHRHTDTQTDIQTYRHTCMHTYLHTYVRTYVHTYIRTYVHTYVRTYVHTYVPTYIHTHTYTYIHIHTHTYTYIHIHTHTYTHIHMYIYIRHVLIHISFLRRSWRGVAVAQPPTRLWCRAEYGHLPACACRGVVQRAQRHVVSSHCGEEGVACRKQCEEPKWSCFAGWQVHRCSQDINPPRSIPGREKPWSYVWGKQWSVKIYWDSPHSIEIPFHSISRQFCHWPLIAQVRALQTTWLGGEDRKHSPDECG